MFDITNKWKCTRQREQSKRAMNCVSTWCSSSTKQGIIDRAEAAMGGHRQITWEPNNKLKIMDRKDIEIITNKDTNTVEQYV